MIRIEEFLFSENIEQSQAESLISKYPNLSFQSSLEFYDYFETQNIRLSKSNITTTSVKTDSQVLLERLKNFKSSTDYDYVRKYIIRQKIIQEALNSGQIESVKNEFDSVTREDIDPFFNFIVRKILTGSENGVLPSERYKSLLDESLRKQQESYDYSVASGEIERDEYGRIVSFKNYLKNRGKLTVTLIDERYSPKTFNHVIDKNFSQIPEAVDAESYILNKAEEWSSDTSVSADEAVLLEKLKELINEDSTSVPALEVKLEKLQLQLKDAEEVQQNLQDTADNLVEAIDQLSNEFNAKVAEVETKDGQIAVLNETIDKTLSDLGTSVTSQIENAADAFDALSSKLEEQAKRAEEQAKAQLDVFKESIGSIADAIKSSNSNTGATGATTGGSTSSTTGGSSGTSGTTGGTQNNTVTTTTTGNQLVSSVTIATQQTPWEPNIYRVIGGILPGTFRRDMIFSNNGYEKPRTVAKTYDISDPYEWGAFVLDRVAGFQELYVVPQNELSFDPKTL
jgi:conjugal transfer/entry exclusion protein